MSEPRWWSVLDEWGAQRVADARRGSLPARLTEMDRYQLYVTAEWLIRRPGRAWPVLEPGMVADVATWPERETQARLSIPARLARGVVGCARYVAARGEAPLPEATSERLDDDDGVTIRSAGQRLHSVEAMAEAHGVDLAKYVAVRSEHRVNEQVTRQNDEVIVVPYHHVSARFELRAGRELRHVTPMWRRSAPPALVPPTAATRIALIPDIQVGYRWRDRHTRLEPLHDRAALEAMVRWLGLVQPDIVVHLGDLLDLAEWSTKYPTSPDLIATTQASLGAAHYWLARCVEAAPDARHVLVAGNHDERIGKLLTLAARPAVGLHAVGDAAPAMDIGRLLALDALGVELVAPYGSDWWHGPLQVTHGSVVRSRPGATVAAMAANTTHSVVVGHIHRVESCHRTTHGPEGRRVHWVASPGCLCRVDGAVPASAPRLDWQQGVGLAVVEGHDVHGVVAPIHGGRLHWQGLVIEGHDDAQREAEATGYPQVAER